MYSMILFNESHVRNASHSPPASEGLIAFVSAHSMRIASSTSWENVPGFPLCLGAFYAIASDIVVLNVLNLLLCLGAFYAIAS